MLLLVCFLLGGTATDSQKWIDGVRTAYEVYGRGHYDAAAKMYRELASRAATEGHPEQYGFALHGWAASLHEQGRLAEAEPIYLRALAAARASPVDASALEIRILNGLTTGYLATARYEEADRTLARLAKLPVSRFPADDALYSVNVGNLLRRRGKVRQAGEVLRSGLTRAESKLGDSSPYVAGLLNVLGLWALQARRPNEAVVFLERSLSIFAARTGLGHPAAARALGHLSQAYLKGGNFERSEQIAARAILVLERQLGPEHPSTALALLTRATALRKLKRSAEAKPLELRGRSILAAAPQRSRTGSVIDVSALQDSPRSK